MPTHTSHLCNEKKNLKKGYKDLSEDALSHWNRPRLPNKKSSTSFKIHQVHPQPCHGFIILAIFIKLKIVCALKTGMFKSLNYTTFMCNHPKCVKVKIMPKSPLNPRGSALWSKAENTKNQKTKELAARHFKSLSHNMT